jgi:hypothetical protein
MNCEKCNKEHDGRFGSGRFCSRQCANSRNLSRETYKEISRKLKQANPVRYVEITCAFCKKLFIAEYSNRSIKCCSRKCAFTPGQHHWRVKDSSKMGGLRDRGGKSKVYEYINWLGNKMYLNNHEIRLAKILDQEKLNWQRNNKGFQYINLKGENRKFHPDFYLPTFDLYVEYKGWLTNEMKHKMKDALSKNNFKLLVIYSDDKRYKDLGISISCLENDRSLLYGSLV